jgi:ribosomal-protein-alanine N-acetyltransferase
MPEWNVEIRTGAEADLPAIAAIQDASPQSARWKVSDYLDYDLLIASVGNSIAGYLVYRTVAPGEREILDLAVSPDFRRRGVGKALFGAAIAGFQGLIFLEVRESNRAGRDFYKSLNFEELTRREQYYHAPPEAAIVMKFHSC